MSKPKTLTVSELKSLLLALFAAMKSQQAKFKARLQREFGDELPEEQPEVIVIKTKITDWISDVVARRLKRNRRTTPLLSSRDFVRCVPAILDLIAQMEGAELAADERATYEKFLKAMFEQSFELVHSLVLPRQDPYQRLWCQITTVLDLADERHITPTELLACEEATDEFTRRMFTRRQYVTLAEKRSDKFLDASALSKIIIQPMLDAVADEGDDEERRELERELETELMPQLRENLKRSKKIVYAWINEEVARIYGTT